MVDLGNDVGCGPSPTWPLTRVHLTLLGLEGSRALVGSELPLGAIVWPGVTGQGLCITLVHCLGGMQETF